MFTSNFYSPVSFLILTSDRTKFTKFQKGFTSLMNWHLKHHCKTHWKRIGKLMALNMVKSLFLDYHFLVISSWTEYLELFPWLCHICWVKPQWHSQLECLIPAHLRGDNSYHRTGFSSLKTQMLAYKRKILSAF